MATTLGQALEKMLKKYRLEKPIRLGEALYLWEEIVGSKIARHTQPEKVAFGKLYIKVDSPVWRSELLFNKARILEKLNDHLKNVKIKEIVLR
jgi:predicted nucleic acid-binding Zn ribbon protein